jgi:hypothetical protein
MTTFGVTAFGGISFSIFRGKNPNLSLEFDIKINKSQKNKNKIKIQYKKSL